ncbi:MAG: hypothetical protein ACYTEZ_00240 [Planctomycetota bacterium]|jgi:hypothetical protein
MKRVQFVQGHGTYSVVIASEPEQACHCGVSDWHADDPVKAKITETCKSHTGEPLIYADVEIHCGGCGERTMRNLLAEIQGVTVVRLEDHPGLSMAARRDSIEDDLGRVRVSVALTTNGLEEIPISGDVARGCRLVEDVLVTDLVQVDQGGGGSSPCELDYRKLADESGVVALHWRRTLDPVKFGIPMWCEFVDTHAPEL